MTHDCEEPGRPKHNNLKLDNHGCFVKKGELPNFLSCLKILLFLSRKRQISVVTHQRIVQQSCPRNSKTETQTATTFFVQHKL